MNTIALECVLHSVLHSLCACISLCGVFACVSTQVIFACGIECLPHVAWPCCLSGHYRICSWIVSTQGFYPSSWPRRSLPFQTVCRAFPTALLRFSYSTRHVLFITCCHGLSKATMTNAAFLFMKRPCWRHTSNHHYHPVLCTCKICFVGMRRHNSKAGGHLICKNQRNAKFRTSCHLKKSWENSREDVSIINSQTCGFITEQHSLFSDCKRTQRTYSMKQSMLVTAQYNYCISVTPPHCSQRSNMYCPSPGPEQ